MTKEKNEIGKCVQGKGSTRDYGNWMDAVKHTHTHYLLKKSKQNCKTKSFSQ